MKLLLDACVWGGARQELEAAGHDVVWAGEWPTDPGDEEILAHAHREGRVLVTLDKDFGELAVVYKIPHSSRPASYEKYGAFVNELRTFTDRQAWQKCVV